ncbi:hypothetical protein, variant [Sphaeroforma arctica JP610]|nr:hypothetical protein, variant [Sphaeroforma arctica JP610]KNC81898.1 hypothetical protein, variant [Sphaeroforma arctica JP610]|eukprot:XP_014155800.1 hypothetical protein, variant [Sphaeroforma arctica JP610]
MDIFSVTTADGVNYGHLEVFLGLLSDIDLESECVRWMGEIRLTLWCIVRLLSLRRENCTMSWLPIEKTSNDVAGNTTDEAQGYGPKRHFAGKELTADWTTEVMDFTTILLMNVPWISMDGWASPFASNDDGGLDLIYSNKGRPELQAMLLAEREPYAANHPDDYKFHKVKALKFEYTTLPEAGGKINVDGEDMGHHKSIEVESHRKLMSFLAPKSLVLPKYAWPPHNEMYPLAVRRPSDVSTVDP